MPLVRYVLGNVRRRARESLLVGAAVFVAAHVLLTQLAQRHGVELRARRVLVGSLSGDYLVVPRNAPRIDVLSSQFDGWPRFTATPAQIAALHLPNGLSASPRLRFGALLARGDRSIGINAQAVTPDQLQRLSSALELEDGLISAGDTAGLLISQPVCAYLRCHVGDTVVILATNRDGYLNDDLLVIRAIYSNHGVAAVMTGTAYMPYRRGHTLIGLAPNETMELVVARRDPADLPPDGEASAVQGAVAAVNPQLAASPWDVTAPIFRAIILIWRSAGVVTQIVFAALSFLLLLNVVLGKVFGRRREIGTLMALGFSPTAVTALITFEYLAVVWSAVLACLVVVVASIASLHGKGIPVFADAMETAYMGTRIYPRLEWGDAAWVTILFTLVTVLGVALPMMRFRRIVPAALLRTST